MSNRNGAWILALGIILMVVGANVDAQQKVYKWVDEDGVVHFSETPPDESASVETETITTAKSPPYVSSSQSVNKSPAAPRTDEDTQVAQPDIQTPPAARKVDITAMSISDLDRRCADAREKKIAPLREVEIAKCKQQDRTDPAYCERVYASYGDGGRNQEGFFYPPMFHDLPECVEFDQEKRRRR
jgi:hypothetical protein